MPEDVGTRTSTAAAEHLDQHAASRRGPLKAALVLALGMAAALAVGELTCRILVSISRDPMLRTTVRDYGRIAHGELGQFRFMPDAQLPYRLKPGFTTRNADGRPLTVHNADGFRADADFTAKAPGTFRIVCLGGSTTYGVTAEHNAGTYPAALERYLNGPMKPPGVDRVEVLNLGVGGYTSREVLQNLQLHALPLEPDAILIQSAVNDVAPRFYDDFACDYSHFRKPMEELEPRSVLRYCYRSHLFLWCGYKLGRLGPLTLQSRTQHPLPPANTALGNLERNGPDCYRANLEAAVRMAKEAGAAVALLTQPFLQHPDFEAPSEEMRRMDTGYRTGLAEHNAVVRSVAVQEQIPCVDLEAVMPTERRYFADPIHMTEPGNNVKGRLVAGQLNPIF